MPERRLSSAGRETLSRDERLRRRSEYRECYEKGRRQHGRFIVLHVLPNRHTGPRLGITLTRKVGGAVIRHRIRRRIREIYRRWEERRSLPAIDIVVHVRPPAREASFQELRKELTRLLGRLLPAESRGR